MHAIFWFIVAWILCFEVPVTLLAFSQSRKIFNEIKNIVSRHLLESNIVNEDKDQRRFLEANSALVKDTQFHRYSFQKNIHLFFIVIMCSVIAKSPPLLIFLAFPFLGFIQDFVLVRKEQLQKLQNLPSPKHQDVPAGIAFHKKNVL